MDRSCAGRRGESDHPTAPPLGMLPAAAQTGLRTAPPVPCTEIFTGPSNGGVASGKAAKMPGRRRFHRRCDNFLIGPANRHRIRFVDVLRQPKVEQLHLSVVGQNGVRWLHVAVQNPACAAAARPRDSPMANSSANCQGTGLGSACRSWPWMYSAMMYGWASISPTR